MELYKTDMMPDTTETKVMNLALILSTIDVMGLLCELADVFKRLSNDASNSEMKMLRLFNQTLWEVEKNLSLLNKENLKEYIFSNSIVINSVVFIDELLIELIVVKITSLQAQERCGYIAAQRYHKIFLLIEVIEAAKSKNYDIEEFNDEEKIKDIPTLHFKATDDNLNIVQQNDSKETKTESNKIINIKPKIVSKGNGLEN